MFEPYATFLNVRLETPFEFSQTKDGHKYCRGMVRSPKNDFYFLQAFCEVAERIEKMKLAKGKRLNILADMGRYSKQVPGTELVFKEISFTITRIDYADPHEEDCEQQPKKNAITPIDELDAFK